MGKSVIIVGSGVAGSTIASGMLKRNDIDKVFLLEAGTSITMRDTRKWQDVVTTGSLPYDESTDESKDYTTQPEKVELEGSRLFIRGGTTIHWGGWALRYKPEDFYLQSNTGRELDWPYNYDELEPYYHQAELSLGISGDSLNTDVPRNGKKYRYEAPPFCQPDSIVISALKNRRYTYSHLPIARYGDGRCMTIGTCKYCPIGGRYSADMTLDELEREHLTSGRFEVLLKSAVTEITFKTKQKVSGVKYYHSSGEIKTLKGDAVILCSGAIETPKLLLVSKNDYWPKGIGNNTGHVGKHFKSHPLIWATGDIPSNPDRIQQEIGFPTLCSRNFDTKDYQKYGKFFFVRAKSSPDVRLEKLMQEGKSIPEIDSITRGPMKIRLEGFIEEFSSATNFVDFDLSDRSRFKLPRTVIQYTQLPEQKGVIEKYHSILAEILKDCGATNNLKTGIYTPRPDHATSTTRMSISDVDGVVDHRLSVHGTDNLFICSNAVFPNITAVNPTLTLVAIAHRFIKMSSDLL